MHGLALGVRGRDRYWVRYGVFRVLLTALVFGHGHTGCGVRDVVFGVEIWNGVSSAQKGALGTLDGQLSAAWIRDAGYDGRKWVLCLTIFSSSR